jgi:integrase
VKYVNRVVDGKGVERLYFRKAGLPSVKLKSPWGSQALQHEVDAILGLAPAKPEPSTLRAALRAYELDSADFATLEDSTKYLYRQTMKELEDDFGDLLVSRFTPAYLLELRNLWAERGYRATAIRLQVLKNALWPAIVAGKLGGGDPFALIPGVRRPRNAGEPHRMWPDEVVVTVIEAAIEAGKIGLARGVAIGRWQGSRREDIVRLTLAARRSGRFAFITGKRKVPVDRAEDPALTAVFAATPHNHLILAPNLEGLAYTADGFALELKKLIQALAKARKIDSAEYDVHGLRHTFGVELALSGCTDAEGAAAMGHSSPASFATYRRQADRICLADNATAKIEALREREANGAVQNRLQNLCKIEPVRQAKPRRKRGGKSTS